MLRRGAATFALSIIIVLAAAAQAGAVLKGTSAGSLSAYTVRLVGNGSCSGVVIARRVVATARHCAYRMTVVAEHRYYRVARVSRLATLDDGRRVKATGDSSFLHLARPLPETVAAVPVADSAAGDPGDTFIIAGYGGGRLRQASLVADSDYALVDPLRKGSISASACFGDSGGPVMRGGWLVGVITRAAHPSPRRACGHLTRWAPITMASEAWVAAMEAMGEEREAASRPATKRRARRSRPVRSKQATATGWQARFTPPARVQW